MIIAYLCYMVIKLVKAVAEGLVYLVTRPLRLIGKRGDT